MLCRHFRHSTSIYSRNICSVTDCENIENCQLCSQCSVVNWVTFAQYQRTLYDSSHTISKPMNLPGNDIAYDCTRSQDATSSTCDCPSHEICTGDAQFCTHFTCNETSKCFCSTKTLHIGTYVSISEDFGFDAPAFVSYKACIFNAPPSQSRTTRHLLSIESSEFSQGDIHIQFQNPIFTFSVPGTFIGRKDGLELVRTIKGKILQYILPNDFRYYEGTLTFTFVNLSGSVLTGTLESTLLRSAPVVIHLRFKNMRISLHHTKICPQIVSVTSVTGCHSCQLAAKIIIRAKSVCSSGQASVSFNNIPLSTRSVHLNTDVSDVTIHFVTSTPCHEERLCLLHNELRSCEPISFCLDAPTIRLSQRNISSAQSIALLQSSGLFDSFISSTESFGSAVKTGLFLVIGTLAVIFIFSSLLTLLRQLTIS